MIDLKPIAVTEKQPLALQRCAIGHCNWLGMYFNPSAIRQFECG
jgi:hypothetical protein